MAARAKRTDEKLWEKVKARVTKGSKGGDAGEWSARKAQLAVSEYKKAGGGYEGGKSADNSLTQWTKEDWGTKSGKKSGETHERYLPRKAREELSDAEYARTTAAKRRDTAKGKQFSSQPKDVARKTAKARDTGKDTTKKAPARKAAAKPAAKRSTATTRRAAPAKPRTDAAAKRSTTAARKPAAKRAAPAKGAKAPARRAAPSAKKAAPKRASAATKAPANRGSAAKAPPRRAAAARQGTATRRAASKAPKGGKKA
ncbi:hypothetical protein VQH23_11115 [Pararoseomonas sp. SCSIO 73927]|uniref:hypothetical protein n=1 Tax=Pararoseomonas sp. SCSIO 73927 TaxID=3114537 RepID=UPI0030CAE611